MNKTFIIAEMAGTHDGNQGATRQFIYMAQKSWVNAVKTQWCSDVQKMAQRRHVNSVESYRLLNFPISWHQDLKNRCHDQGLEYICSVFLSEDVQMILPWVDRIKIASLEASDHQLIKACLETNKPVIISTGCLGGEEYLNLRALYHEWCANQGNPCQIQWLHSVSAYPTHIGESNLRVLSRSLKYDFDGYSDQTGRILTGALAVMAGAKILEVHTRLNQTDKKNPDYGHSLTPDQLGEYVRLVRIAEQELGDGIKKIQFSEEPLRKHRVL